MKKVLMICSAIALAVFVLSCVSTNNKSMLAKKQATSNLDGYLFKTEDTSRVPATDPSARTLRSYSNAQVENNYSLKALSTSEKKAVTMAIAGGSKPGTPLKIGVGRNTPTPLKSKFKSSGWKNERGGKVTAIKITTPGAKAVRIAVQAKKFPRGAELRFFHPEQSTDSFGPYTDKDLLEKPEAAKGSPAPKSNKPIWSPVIDGSTVGVEIWVPNASAVNDVDISFPQISHLELSPLKASSGTESDECLKDVQCRYPGEIEKSVAKISFVESGDTYLCTGQLMNSTGSSISRPHYFSTANHCVSEQSVADTITFIWGYQKTFCDGSVPTSITQTTDGAYLLRTMSISTSTDFSLLLLKRSPPSNVMYSGWSTDAARHGDQIIGISHPHGYTKKVGYGEVDKFGRWDSQNFDSHIILYWDYGSTAGGSSGSGIWRNNRLIGVLSGGPATCENPTAYDKYGRFDLSYNNINQWLDPESLDYTSIGSHEGGSLSGKSFKVYKLSKNGLSGSRRVEVRLRPQDRDADLYINSGVAPSFSLYDCKSAKIGTSEDTCSFTFNASSSEDVYIAVYAYDSSGASYSLDITGEGGSNPQPNPTPSPPANPTPQPPTGGEVPPPAVAANCSTNALCLHGNRFQVQVAWKNQFNNTTGIATRLTNTPYSGFFHFGDASNVELIVKLLDFGDHFKFFYGQLTNLKFTIKVTDTQTGTVKLYHNTSGDCGAIDSNAFVSNSGNAFEYVASKINKTDRNPAAACVPSSSTLCLQNGRIKITGAWRNHYNNVSGSSIVKPISVATGGMYFSDLSNLELFVKALDFGTHYLIMYGTLSNLEYNFTVTDTVTNRTKTFNNPAGNYCGGIDSTTFQK